MLLLAGLALPAGAAEITPDAAYALVVRPAWSREARPKPEEIAAARQVLADQSKREPKAAKWIYALAHAARLESQQVAKEAGEKLRKEALAGFEKAVALQPGNADYQVWLATASFDRVDDVNMLSKMSLASDGRKAYEKAIEIDPANVLARVGLAQFYMVAPAIAGGSVDKAKVQAEALLRVPDGAGEFQGYMLSGNIAAYEKNWTEMTAQYARAETAKGLGADPVIPLRALAWRLLNDKKDPQAAAPVAERYVKVAAPDDMTALFLDGEVKRQLGHCDQALPRYDEVLTKFEGARGSRWGAAVCADQLGRKDAALKNYQEYAKRFPDDEHAKDAKAAIKKLTGS